MVERSRKIKVAASVYLGEKRKRKKKRREDLFLPAGGRRKKERERGKCPEGKEKKGGNSIDEIGEGKKMAYPWPQGGKA